MGLLQSGRRRVDVRRRRCCRCVDEGDSGPPVRSVIEGVSRRGGCQSTLHRDRIASSCMQQSSNPSPSPGRFRTFPSPGAHSCPAVQAHPPKRCASLVHERLCTRASSRGVHALGLPREAKSMSALVGVVALPRAADQLVDRRCLHRHNHHRHSTRPLPSPSSPAARGACIDAIVDGRHCLCPTATRPAGRSPRRGAAAGPRRAASPGCAAPPSPTRFPLPILSPSPSPLFTQTPPPPSIERRYPNWRVSTQCAGYGRRIELLGTPAMAAACCGGS